MNIVIFDKNKDYQNKIKNLVEDNYHIKDDLLRVSCYYDVKQFIEANSQCLFQIAFIDTQQRGIDAARQLREVNSSCMIVFMSENDDDIQKAFQLRASDYLFKPFDENTFQQIFYTVLEQYYGRNIKFIVPIRDMRRKRVFQVDDIKYVETYYNDIDIITVEGIHYITHVKNRYRIREVLKSRWFMQVNQSVLVNMKHIDFLTERNVILKTREVFTMSRLTFIENHLKYDSFQKKQCKRRGKR